MQFIVAIENISIFALSNDNCNKCQPLMAYIYTCMPKVLFLFQNGEGEIVRRISSIDLILYVKSKYNF